MLVIKLLSLSHIDTSYRDTRYLLRKAYFNESLVMNGGSRMPNKYRAISLQSDNDPVKGVVGRTPAR